MDRDPDRGSRRRWIPDAILFTIGAAGAAWEIFYDQSQNVYVFALIVALLRLGSGAFDAARELLGGRK